MFISKIPKDDSADSFAEIANAYYQKRLQLLALLDYLSLTECYYQSLAKKYHRQFYKK